MIINKCEMCGVEKIQLAVVSTPEGEKKMCATCFNEFIGDKDPTIDIPVKPKFVRVFNINFSKLGKYKDGEVRYIFDLPKALLGNFDFESNYDVVFIKR